MTRAYWIGAAGLLGSFLPAASLYAQEISEEPAATSAVDDPQRYLSFAPGDSATLAVQSDSGDPVFGPTPSQVFVQSGIAGETIRLTIGSSKSAWEDFRQIDYSISIVAPFNKESQIGNFITQTGLPGAYSVEGALSISLVGSDFTQPLLDTRARDFALMVGMLHRECERRNEALLPADRKTCPSTLAELARDYATDEYQAFIAAETLRAAAAMQESSYLAWQVTGGVGRRPYSHRDPVSLAPISDDRTVFSFASSLLYVPSLGGNMAYIIGAEIERSYGLPSAEIRCPGGPAVPAPVRCFESAFGPPERETEATIFGAIRYNAADLGLPISGEIRVAVDPGSGEWGVEAPIYFLRDADGNLNSGVRVGYDSEDDDVFFGVFVGTNFNFLGG